MKKKEQSISFQIRISSIDILRFSQYDIEDFDHNKLDAIEYQTDFGIKVYEEDSKIGVESVVKLNVKEINSVFGELKVLVKFEIMPFEDLIKKTENGHQISDALMINIFNITAGTIRGILHEKLKGTLLQNEIYPLINIKELLKSQQIK